MSAEVAFTAVSESAEGGWVQDRLVEIPGAVTAAPTRDEATEALLDAPTEYLRSVADESAPHTGGTAVNVTFTAA